MTARRGNRASHLSVWGVVGGLLLGLLSACGGGDPSSETIGVSSRLAASTKAKRNPDPKGQLIELQVLGFNDYHGHLERNTPGSVDGVAAGGAEFLAAKLEALRQGHKFSLTVAAGDLIGGSPAFSGLFHDEPAVESLNAMKLDVSSVGNHEFDEGVTELLRMQNGGCHPVDGCYFPNAPYTGAKFQWLAANVVDVNGRTPLPPYWIKRFNNVDVAFIGMTLEATDTLVAAAGIKGWEFPGRGRDRERAGTHS